MELLSIIIFGWPSAIIGITIIGIGITLKSNKLRISGALITMGFCFYASMYPSPIRWFGILALFGNWISAIWKWKNPVIFQIIFIIPMVILITLLASAVISQK